MAKEIRDRFWLGTDVEGKCLEWTGRLDSDGYGRLGGRLVHRSAYEDVHGPIPDGLHIHHRCHNRSCYNVEHLEALTPREHTLRSPGTLGYQNFVKTHCKWGHEFDADNTYRRANGRRSCRRCNLLAVYRYRYKRGLTPYPFPSGEVEMSTPVKQGGAASKGQRSGKPRGTGSRSRPKDKRPPRAAASRRSDDPGRARRARKGSKTPTQNATGGRS